MRRTKIVATIGPACDSPEGLRALIAAGMDVARLNLSHGSTDVHRDRIRRIREAARAMERTVGIMLDTRGPEVRIGELPEPVTLAPGDRLTLVAQRDPSPDNGVLHVWVNWPGLLSWVSPGQQLLIDDGNLAIRCEATRPGQADFVVEVGGLLNSRKKINCPGVAWPLHPLHAADEEALAMGIAEGIDFVAASFIHRADDVIAVRRFLESHDGHPLLIAKIEDRSAVEHLDEILLVADGVMVARGDLGVEMPAEDVPWLQKEIIQKANRLGLPVITATQMLESMVVAPRPTRAETSDVANAIWDGSDAVMLSAETASGRFPVEAVRVMARVAENADQRPRYLHRVQWDSPRVADAVSRASAEIGESLGARAIITVTESGYTAQMVSRCRPTVPIIAISPHEHVVRRLSLIWGVTTLMMPRMPDSGRLVEEAILTAQNAQWVKPEDVVVVTAGFPPGTPGTTNLLRVETVRGPMLKGQGIGQGQAVSGRVVRWGDAQALAPPPSDEYILVLREWDPRAALWAEGARAVIAETPGLTSDVAVAVITLGIPAVVGVPDAADRLADGQTVTVDAARGLIYQGRVEI